MFGWMRRGHPVGDGGRLAQMSLRHAIGVMVVVDQCRILVRPRHFINTESAVAPRIEMTDVEPYARCLEQNFRAVR